MTQKIRFTSILYTVILSLSPCLILPVQAGNKPVKINKTQLSSKEHLVLMPLRLGEEDQKLQGAMETALVEGLQQKYVVFSGEQVAKKAREIFMKESKNTAHKECDETRCLQGIAESFQSELLAIANVTKEGGGYFLALSIRNLYDNKDVYSKSLTCRGCDQFQAVDKLKELVGPPTSEESPSKNTPSDEESEVWSEVQRGNSKEDYQAYITQYPKGKYLLLAKTRIKKIEAQADAERSQQDTLSWESANSTATAASYQNYLDHYPTGQFSALAQARINKLRNEVVQTQQPAAESGTHLQKMPPAPTYEASTDDAKVIAKVNGITIPQLRMDLRIKAAMEQGQKDSPELRNSIRDDLISAEVIAQESYKIGLDRHPEIVQQIELNLQSVLANAFIQNHAKLHPITETSLQQEYEKLKTRIGNKEYKVSHILVDSENDAKSIAASLMKGGKFDKFAKEKSTDPGSKDKGGDLGWTTPSNFVQPFADAVIALSKGQISAPIQTQFGWHIIKLDDVRELKIPAYEEVKTNLEKRLQQQALQEAIKSLRANVRIVNENESLIVNEVRIPEARIALRIRASAQQGQMESPEIRKKIRDELIDLELISQAAIKKGLNRQPEVAQQIEIAKQSALASAFVQDYTKNHPVSDEKLQQEYGNLKTRVGSKEYKAAHILLASENEALAIAAKLKKGSSFAKLAQEKSNDPGSNEKGGDLGWTVPSNFVQPFADAMIALSKGQISAPVQTQFGWHIIKLDDVRELKVPAYEEVKTNLEKRLQQQALQDAIKSLRTNAKIE